MEALIVLSPLIFGVILAIVVSVFWKSPRQFISDMEVKRRARAMEMGMMDAQINQAAYQRLRDQGKF